MLDCGWWIARLLLVFLSTALLRPATAAVRAGDPESVSRALLAQARHRDTTPPVLVLTTPSEGAVVTTPTIPVRGAVTDEGAVTVLVEGRRVPVRAGVFAADVSLRRGPNQIEVEAIDAAGNRTRVSRQVRFEDLRRIQALVPPVLAAADLPTLGHLTLAPDGAILVTAPPAGRIYHVPADGSPPSVRADHLRDPLGIAAAGDGSLFVAERGADRILRLAPDGTRTVVLERLDDPRGLALGREGDLFITAIRWRAAGAPRAPEAHRGVVVRRDLATGAVRAVADGLVEPEGIVAGEGDAGENVWVVAERRQGEPEWRDADLFRITMAGTVIPIPGPHLWRPLALARDALGSFWLTARRQYGTPDDLDDEEDDERERGVLFKVSAAGVWQRFATHLDEASGLAFAAQGDLLVAEADRGRILRFRAPPAPEVVLPPPTSAPTVTLAGTAEPLVLIVARGPAGTGTGPTDAEGRFQVSVPLLPDQPNRIEVFSVAANGAGLASAPTVLTTVQVGTPPVLAVEMPPPNALINGSPIPVRGRVSGGSPPVRVFVNEAAVPVDVSGEFGAMLPLLEGPNEIRVRVVDAMGTAAIVTRVATLDTTPPSVVVTSPAEGAVVTGTTVAVMGTVRDANPPAIVSVNGQAVPLAPSGQFSSEILLPIAQPTITVTATDRAGNVASAIRQVVRDVTPPILGFVSVPPDPTNSPTLTVTVAATDAVTPADQIQFAFSLDGAIFSPYATVPSVTYPGAMDGVHTIRAKARDQVGNESAPIAMTVRVDTVPPAITLTAPAADFLTNTPRIDVSGSVADVSAISAVSVNGVAASLVGSIFTATVTLAEGANSLSVSARDAAGNTGTATVGGTLDTTAPVVTITAPATGFLTNQPALTVIGTVTDAATITAVTVNGQAVTLTGTGFSRSLVLGEGANTITVTARDTAGNTGTAVVSGILDTVVPVITFTAPSADAVLNTTPLTVTGTVSEAVTSLTVNGSAATVSGGTFSVSLVPTRGRNTLTATATDPAGNVGTATRSVTFDDVAPVVRILTPASGQILSQTSLTVTGTVDDPTATVTVNGVPATLSGGLFTASGVTVSAGPVTLTAQARDAAGNVGTAQITLTVDTTPPTLTALTVPNEVTAGTAVTLAAEASDNLGLATLDLLVDGRLVASGTTSPVSVSFTIPPDKGVNETLTVTARVVDTAGQATTQLATMRVTGAAVGPGFLRGLVLDDTKGLPLAGATVTVVVEGAPPVDPQVTGADGQYAVTVDPGTALVRIAKEGATAGERKVSVRSDLLSTVADVRLTPRDTAVSLIGASGGTAADTANALRLTLPAGALTVDASVTLTPISAQGLIARLPLGWTPILVVDLAPASLSLAAPGTLSVRVPEGWQTLLPVATAVPVARYDPAQGWIALDAATVTNDGLALEVAIPITGQVAFLLPDATPQAPPSAVAGQPLTGVAFAAIPEDATAVGAVTPSAIPPGTSIATGQVTVTPTAPLPSGTLVQAVVSETYSLLTGEEVTPPAVTQELVLYQSGEPRATSRESALGAAFAVTPSRQYTLKDLAIGTVHVALQTPETGGQGTIIGPEGGTITAADGTILTIPAGALSRETVVAFAALAESDLRVAVPAGFQVLKAITLDLTRATLLFSAELAFPLPAGITGDTQVLVARVLEVDGVLKLQAVGLGQVNGGLLSSKGAVAGVSLPSITSGGTYVALRATSPVGFVAGTITDAASAAKAGVLVSSSTGLVDVSRSDGRYLVAVAAGSATIIATDRATGQGATQAVAVSTGSAATQPLQVQVIPPTVLSVSPAAGSRNIPVNSTVTLTFSQAIAKVSLTASSLVLSNPTGSVEATITLSPLGTEATLYPSKALASQTTYSLVASQAIQDTHGVALPTPFTSQFTTASAPPPPPAAGAITVSFPDEQGNVTVTATQGTSPPDCLVVVLNVSSGTVASATVGANGGFSASLFAMLGDELLVMIQDAAGNQTVVSPGPYRSADGQFVMTRSGGSLDTAEGISLTLAPSAVSQPVTLKVTPLTLDQVATAIPATLQFLGGLRLDTQGANFKTGAKVSFPIPSGVTIPIGAQPFLARLQTINGQLTPVLVDTLRVATGKLMTASPPFPGVQKDGDYVALLPTNPYPAVVTGTVVRDGTTPAQPIVGAILKVDGVEVAAATDDKGKYALELFTTDTTKPTTFNLTVLDPTSGALRGASLTVPAWTVPAGGGTYTLDVALPSAGAGRDTTPPTVTLTVDAPSLKGGRVALGDTVTVTVKVADDIGVRSDTLTLTKNGTSIPLALGSSGIATATIPTTTPWEPISLEATAQDTSGNVGQAEATIQVTGGDGGPETPPPAPAGQPFKVVSAGTFPPKDATQADTATTPMLFFSQPVVNASPDLLFLRERDLDSGAETTVDSDVLVDPSDASVVTLKPKSRLRYRATYSIVAKAALQGANGVTLGQDFTSNYSTLDLTGSTIAVTSGRDVVILGKYAIFLDRTDGLVTVDINDPTKPEIQATTAVFTGPFAANQGFALAKDFVYLDATGHPVYAPAVVVVGWISLPQGGVRGLIRLFDLSDPVRPKRIGSATLARCTTGVPTQVIVMGQYAVVASLLQGLVVVDLNKVIGGTLQDLGLSVGDGATDAGTTLAIAGPIGMSLSEDAADARCDPGRPKAVVAIWDDGGLLKAPASMKVSGATAIVGDLFTGVYQVSLAGLPTLNASHVCASPAFRVDVLPSVEILDPITGNTRSVSPIGVTSGTTLSVVDPGTGTVISRASLGGAGFSILTDISQRFLFVGTSKCMEAYQLTATGTLEERGCNPTIPAVSGAMEKLGENVFTANNGKGAGGVQVEQRALEIELYDARSFGPTYTRSSRPSQPGALTFAMPLTTLPSGAPEMKGAQADGVSLLVVRATIPEGSTATSATFTLKNDLSEPDTAQVVGGLFSRWPSAVEVREAPGSQSITVKIEMENGRKVAAAVYRPPVEFVTSAGHMALENRRVRISVATEETPSRQTARNIRIDRPPLALVHGYASGPSTWRDLLDKRRGLVRVGELKHIKTDTADYMSINTTGVDRIYQSVSKTVEELLKRSRGDGIAATRADILAHSMGGLATWTYVSDLGGSNTTITRPSGLRSGPIIRSEQDYHRRSDNYGAGTINRIITIGTPYRGSALADKVLQILDRPDEDPVRHLAVMNFGNPDRSAYADFATNSVATIMLRSQGSTTIPTHAIAGIARSVFCQAAVLGILGLTLPFNESDLIVSIASQKGRLHDNTAGLPDESTTEIDGECHTDETNTPFFRLGIPLLQPLQGLLGFPPSSEPQAKKFYRDGLPGR